MTGAGSNPFHSLTTLLRPSQPAPGGLGLSPAPQASQAQGPQMTAVGNNSLGTRSQLAVGLKTYAYYSLEKAAAQLGDVSRLPFSMKVLLENLLRFEDGKTVTRADIQALVDW